jgi:hypothetical protein
MADQSSSPQGWRAAVGTGLFVAAALMLLAWIWQGDWRWGATAGVAVVAALAFLGPSMQPRAGERGAGRVDGR